GIRSFLLRRGGSDRFADGAELIEERLRDEAVLLHRRIPGDHTLHINNLMGVGDGLLGAEARLAHAPTLAEKAQEMHLAAVDYSVVCPTDHGAIQVVNFAGGIILVG